MAKYDQDKIDEEKRNLVGKINPASVSVPNNKTGRAIPYTQNDLKNPNAVLYSLMQAEAQKKVTSKAWSKMEIPDIRKMPFGNEDDLIELVANSSAKKLGKTREGLDSTKEAKLKALLPRIHREMSDERTAAVAARAAGNIAGANQKDDRADALSKAWVEINSW